MSKVYRVRSASKRVVTCLSIAFFGRRPHASRPHAWTNPTVDNAFDSLATPRLPSRLVPELRWPRRPRNGPTMTTKKPPQLSHCARKRRKRRNASKNRKPVKLLTQQHSPFPLLHKNPTARREDLPNDNALHLHKRTATQKKAHTSSSSPPDHYNHAATSHNTRL